LVYRKDLGALFVAIRHCEPYDPIVEDREECSAVIPGRVSGSRFTPLTGGPRCGIRKRPAEGERITLQRSKPHFPPAWAFIRPDATDFQLHIDRMPQAFFTAPTWRVEICGAPIP
jgi:hypothetical protein